MSDSPEISKISSISNGASAAKQSENTEYLLRLRDCFVAEPVLSNSEVLLAMTLEIAMCKL